MERFGAPYFGIHRADLQKTLSTAFGVENVHLGCRLVNIVQQSGSVVLEFANGRIEHADVVVGADGVRSTVRRWVTGADDALYSGTSAFRGIVPIENLPSLPDPQAIQFWMGRTRTCCTTPSAATASRSTSSRSWKPPGSGCRRPPWSTSLTRCRWPPSGAGTLR